MFDVPGIGSRRLYFCCFLDREQLVEAVRVVTSPPPKYLLLAVYWWSTRSGILGVKCLFLQLRISPLNGTDSTWSWISSTC